VVSVPQRKLMARYLLEHYPVSQRRACQLSKLPRKTFRYQSKRPSQEALRKRIVELAKSRVRYGYKRIHVLLMREGIHVNKKRVHRLYCLEGLQLRAKRPRRSVSAATRQPPKHRPTAPNVAWSMDFVSDQTSSGTKFRALTIVDVFTRECLAIEPGKSLKGEDVARVLTEIAKRRPLPQRIHCDNGSEFSGRSMDLWAYANQVVLEFSRPGTPTDNAYIESFNGSLRDECLNVHWFSDLTDAREKLQAWRTEYNVSRPHRSLDNQSPNDFADHWAQQRQKVAVPLG
jgi:putative transposase